MGSKSQKRRAQRKAAKRRLFEEVNFTCSKCGWVPTLINEDPPTDGNRILTVDHKIEACLGGPSNSSNYEVMCSRCNNQKSTRLSKVISDFMYEGHNKEEARAKAAELLGLPYLRQAS